MIVAFNDGNTIKATLQITDNEIDQIVIRFIPYRDEHITLHLNNDGSVVRTHYKDDKEKSVWDETRVQVATAMGNPNPDRHGKYVINTRLPEVDNIEGYYLGGRLIDLTSFTPMSRYSNNIDHIFSSGFTKFMLQIYLSTTNNPRSGIGNRVTTSIGEVCFEFEETKGQ